MYLVFFRGFCRRWDLSLCLRWIGCQHFEMKCGKTGFASFIGHCLIIYSRQRTTFLLGSLVKLWPRLQLRFYLPSFRNSWSEVFVRLLGKMVASFNAQRAWRWLLRIIRKGAVLVGVCIDGAYVTQLSKIVFKVPILSMKMVCDRTLLMRKELMVYGINLIYAFGSRWHASLSFNSTCKNPSANTKSCGQITNVSLAQKTLLWLHCRQISFKWTSSFTHRAWI